MASMTELERKEAKREKAQKEWNEKFQQDLAAGKLVYTGGGKYMDKEVHRKMVEKTNEFLRKHPGQFLGELEHPTGMEVVL